MYTEVYCRIIILKVILGKRLESISDKILQFSLNEFNQERISECTDIFSTPSDTNFS